MIGHALDLPPDVQRLVEEAWEARAAIWPPTITAVIPVDTLPISVTGRSCALDCAHCGGHYLAGMRPLNEIHRVTTPSILISGGCDTTGRVPIREHLDTLRPLIAGLRTNWHLGLVTPADVAALQGLLDIVSFDFVGDDETIHEVYGIAASGDDYERSFALLSTYTEVVPHVTIGLRGGDIGHEWAALERLADYNFQRLVFLVLIPTPGTRYANVAPPPLAEVTRLIATARLRFPSVSLQIGCMRPKGAYRRTLDILAVRAGMNVIVNPVQSAFTVAEELGLRWLIGHECCVFAPL